MEGGIGFLMRMGSGIWARRANMGDRGREMEHGLKSSIGNGLSSELEANRWLWAVIHA